MGPSGLSSLRPGQWGRSACTQAASGWTCRAPPHLLLLSSPIPSPNKPSPNILPIPWLPSKHKTQAGGSPALRLMAETPGELWSVI